MDEPFLIISRTADDDVETRVNLVFEDPFAFGMALVDAARVIAKAFGDSEGGIEQGYLDRLKDGFDAEWSKPTTVVNLTEKPLARDAALKRHLGLAAEAIDRAGDIDEARAQIDAMYEILRDA